jgi:hypothetical protein
MPTITSVQRKNIEDKIKSFLEKRYEGIRGLRLDGLNINPFLARALKTHLVIEDPKSIVSFFVRQRLERGLVTAMGTLLQNIAKEFADTTGVEGADLQVDRDRRYYMEIKSGPETINKGMLQNYDRKLRSATRRNGNAVGAIGLCYGTRQTLGAIISRYLPEETSLELFVGKELWEVLGGDTETVYEVFDIIGTICDSYTNGRGQTLTELVDTKIDELTRHFIDVYGEGGQGMWDQLLEKNV